MLQYAHRHYHNLFYEMLRWWAGISGQLDILKWLERITLAKYVKENIQKDIASLEKALATGNHHWTWQQSPVCICGGGT
jgi:hypothetical protein